MRRSHIETDTSGQEINLTPLIDLVFILLIFFLVTASFKPNTALEINRPQAQTATLQTQPQQAVIEINAEGAVYLEKQPVELSSLRHKVALLQQDKPKLQIILIADQQALTGLLVRVMDQVRLAGISQIAIAAIPDKPQ